MGLVVTCSILPFNQRHLHLNAAVACSDSMCCKCVKERLCVCVLRSECVRLMEASASPSCISGNH